MLMSCSCKNKYMDHIRGGNIRQFKKTKVSDDKTITYSCETCGRLKKRKKPAKKPRTDMKAQCGYRVAWQS